MKFSCYKSDLLEALAFAAQALPNKPQTPILSGIYLHADNSSLEIQANNFSTGIIARIPVNVEERGAVVVSGKRLVNFAKNMPDDTISFTVEGNSLRLDSGGANVDLLTMNPDDFPKVKTPDVDGSLKILPSLLHDLIKRTIYAVAKVEDRPIFTGVLVEIKGDTITLVATNTHRLALAKAKLPDSYPDCSFVVPANTLRTILSRINPKDTDNYITINYSTRYLTFQFDNVFVNSRLLEGMFPPYNNVFPKSSDIHTTVDTNDFEQAINFVALMSKETEYNTVTFNVGDDAIEISSNSSEVGAANKFVDADIDGGNLQIAFNVAYISDVLKVVDSTKLNIAFNDKYSPALFTEPGNDNFVYLATPVRG